MKDDDAARIDPIDVTSREGIAKPNGHGGAVGKRPRKHLLGLPTGYKFDPNTKPTADDLAGVPMCFGDEEPTMTTAQPYPQ